MATQKNIIDQVFPETLKILSELIKFQTVSGTSNLKLIEYCEKTLSKLGAISFKTFDEVIERANDNDLGLCSYLYTNSMDKAHIGSEKLESGCVAVNTGVVALAEAPFGGIKQTGYGREGGSGAIKDYLNVKYTHMGIKG